ncbi:MAG TPA: type II toxin-antitoxin system VapC family toxin [Terriglobales bacterium]
MAVRYLLDTNTASYAIKGNVLGVRQRLQKCAPSEVAISVITESELRFGVLRLPGAERLAIVVEEFLRFIDVRPWDSAAAQNYAQLRASIEQEGRPIGNLDLMIAAHSLALGTTLVSSDRVFRRVKELRLEDWSRA